MIDAKITAIGGGQHDLVIVDGDLVLIGDTEATHPEAVQQGLTYTFGTWLGESPFDRTVGFPWLEAVFGSQPTDGIGALVYEYAVNSYGVEGLDEAPTLDFDAATQRLFIDAQVKGRGFAETIQIEVAG